MGHIIVSELEWAPPGHDALFFDVGFTVSPGEHAALIGVNGVGKSTILRILVRRARTRRRVVLDRRHGAADDAGRRHVEPRHDAARDADRGRPAAAARRRAGARRGRDGDARRAATTAWPTPSALHDWGDLGGYELEAQWEAAAQRSVKTPVDDFATRTIGELSGGERKRLVLDVLLNSGADVLLLDEPDNYLDVPTRGWLEEQIKVVQVDDPHGQPRPHAALATSPPR